MRPIPGCKHVWSDVGRVEAEAHVAHSRCERCGAYQGTGPTTGPGNWGVIRDPATIAAIDRARDSSVRLSITCDTNVVIDALDGTRPAAVDLFALVRAGDVDIAFSTRLEDELQRHTLDELRALVASEIVPLPTAGRYGASRYDGGDMWAAEPSPLPMLPPTPWRLDFGRLGVDTSLGGASGELSTPTLDGIGSLKGIDSDHLEAHRRAQQDVFVTSDVNLIKAARKRGIDAATPEEITERLRQHQLPERAS